ncbi:MAG TPA: hypothetical protein IAB01_00080 [Candidatus Avidesulfovibrio excrementigallinarum]|nr:hypothetical protein [Candidatus Avidesulfovibrio excrementigallinarum]
MTQLSGCCRKARSDTRQRHPLPHAPAERLLLVFLPLPGSYRKGISGKYRPPDSAQTRLPAPLCHKTPYASNVLCRRTGQGFPNALLCNCALHQAPFSLRGSAFFRFFSLKFHIVTQGNIFLGKNCKKSLPSLSFLPIRLFVAQVVELVDTLS